MLVDQEARNLSLSRTLESLSAELGESKKKVAELSQAVSDYDVRLQALGETITSKDSRIRTLEEEMSALGSALEEERKKSQSLTGKNELLEHQLVGLKQDLKVAKDNVEDVTAKSAIEIDSLSRKAADLIAETERLTSKVETSLSSLIWFTYTKLSAA
jgi:chromosome segregation ATPase